MTNDQTNNRSAPPVPERAMPPVEIDDEMGSPQAFEHVKHARRHDGTRGVEISTLLGCQANWIFLDYAEAVKLHEALGAALAFLDD